MLVLLREGFKNHVEKESGAMIYIPSFMKTGTGVQLILMFCLSKLNGYDGITNRRDLRSA
jgi:hypothetical protein